MTKESFLDPGTGPYKRLDNTAWYIKQARIYSVLSEYAH